jgi:hypothetical protein
VELRGAVLSLPPHNPGEMQKFCLDCAIEVAFLWSVSQKKNTYNKLEDNKND